MTTLTSPPHTQPATRPLAQRHETTGRPGLVSALRSETLKLATVRSYRAIAALTVLVGGFAAFAVATLVTDEVITVAGVFSFSTVFTAVFAAVAGILTITTEAEHRTLPQTYAAQPRRQVVIVAKALVVTTFAVTLALVGLAAGALGAALGGVEMGDTASIPETIGWSVGFAALAAVLGFGIGLIARHSAAAISGLLVWWLVVESLATVFIDARYARFLPFVAGNGMLGIVNEDDATAFPPATSAVVFAGYATLALVMGIIVAHRSDP
ncbi:MAG: hypothetical protein AAFN30_15645 [Actinomycetota bacterium]